MSVIAPHPLASDAAAIAAAMRDQARSRAGAINPIALLETLILAALARLLDRFGQLVSLWAAGRLPALQRPSQPGTARPRAAAPARAHRTRPARVAPRRAAPVAPTQPMPADISPDRAPSPPRPGRSDAPSANQHRPPIPPRAQAPPGFACRFSAPAVAPNRALFFRY